MPASESRKHQARASSDDTWTGAVSKVVHGRRLIRNDEEWSQIDACIIDNDTNIV